MPKDMPDRMPEGMPDKVPECLPDNMPEDMPDRMPDRMPEEMPPEGMPDRMPEDMPDRMPEGMPDKMSDRMPEDLPVTKCINVMVGITRSKVFFFGNAHIDPWLVVSNTACFSIIYGMSSFPLSFIFFKMATKPPTRYISSIIMIYPIIPT